MLKIFINWINSDAEYCANLHFCIQIRSNTYFKCKVKSSWRKKKNYVHITRITFLLFCLIQPNWKNEQHSFSFICTTSYHSISVTVSMEEHSISPSFNFVIISIVESKTSWTLSKDVLKPFSNRRIKIISENPKN